MDHKREIINIRSVQLKDVKALRSCGLLKGHLRDCEELVRKLLSSGPSYIVAVDDVIVCLSHITVKGSSSGIDIRYTDCSSAERGIALDEILRKAFLGLGLHKVSVILYDGCGLDEKMLTDRGFVQEAVLREYIKTQSGYEDAGLFSLLRPDLKLYSVGFVPFPAGILSVYGGITSIDRIDFLSYEGTVEDDLALDCAISLGLIGGDGKLRKRGSEEYDILIEDNDKLPYELGRACSELREYFLKQRCDFDINIRLPEHTAFQERVWDQLKKIPYGDTVSYEDIALKLTDGDASAARKLTRAVGSACSENPVPVIIPCHRVIGKNGKLTGFRGGLEFKDYLLSNEMFSAVYRLS